MSMFNWLSSKGKPEPVPESTGLLRTASTGPYSHRQGTHGSSAAAHAQSANRKQERMHQRELLYAVVRDSMTHAGLPSTSYKFKVLSLDARGRQFLIMVDLGAEAGRETLHLSEIEALIARNGKTRHDIVVTAVYWRMNDHVTVGKNRSASNIEPMVTPTQDARPSEMFPSTQPFDPAQGLQDEMALFKRALAGGASGSEAMAAARTASGADDGKHHGPQSYTLLTGFEDTEMADPDAPLSATQYGGLR